jgi:hypothetical protein
LGLVGELLREGLAGVGVCSRTFPLFVCVYVCMCVCVCFYEYLRGHYLFGPGVIVFICISSVPRKDIARVKSARKRERNRISP